MLTEHEYKDGVKADRDLLIGQFVTGIYLIFENIKSNYL